MNFNVKILAIKSLTEIPGYWTDADYAALLDDFGYEDAASASHEDLPELLKMAISDFEPDDAAKIVLQYRLHDRLKPGQIENMSHHMTSDNETEVYPDISLHYPLYSINRLLHDAYGGVFPSSKASRIDLEMVPVGEGHPEMNREIALKALNTGLSDRCLVHRLYEGQLQGKEPFGDTGHIIWELQDLGDHRYTLITSDYWISREDIVNGEFEAEVVLHEEED